MSPPGTSPPLKRKPSAGMLADMASEHQPPPALRRNYTVCALLHDRSEEDRDQVLAGLIGYKFAVVDARTGRLLEVSEAFANAVCVPAHELCGDRLQDWLSGDDARHAVAKALDENGPLSLPVRMRCADGSDGVAGDLCLPVDPVRLGSTHEWRLCLVVDSATEAAELQLQRLATCLHLPMPVAPALRDTLSRLQRTFVVTDPALEDNPIVFASESFCKMTGYERSELVGRNCRLLQGPGTDLSVIRKVRHAVKDGRSCTAELVNYRKDGTSFKNLLHFAPVRDPSGSIAYFVGVQTDLSSLVPSEARARGILPSSPELKGGLPLARGAGVAQAAVGAEDGAVDALSRGPGHLLRSVPASASAAALAEEARRTAATVDSALSQHLRDVLTTSMLMHTAGDGLGSAPAPGPGGMPRTPSARALDLAVRLRRAPGAGARGAAWRWAARACGTSEDDHRRTKI
eukprot:CAMPEP_0185192384 /NCGR_PEP_ID=MMETSP1140-20130426/18280_1 /TAXON_ID=298111 /ORGANISM="Pavlova sp., Strain CCMP459" /LENGTH=459 /DNA_ID=CAMNT_0027759129 /DNA_START=74 /DNA_END=1454 /DNA_ORIENTATION=+